MLTTDAKKRPRERLKFKAGHFIGTSGNERAAYTRYSKAVICEFEYLSLKNQGIYYEKCLVTGFTSC